MHTQWSYAAQLASQCSSLVSDGDLLPATADAHPGFRSLGALAWISTLQFFIAQAVVQSAWNTPFRLTKNYISDLGNTACAPFPPGSDSYVCSPWHALMNASFLATGVAVVLGAWLLRDAFRPSRLRLPGVALVALGGAGFVLVGLFPENVNFPPHRLGAALHFVGGNLGLLVLGFALLRTSRSLGAFSIVSGLVGLSATALFVSGHYVGAGIGGMERLAAYPLPLWATVMGVCSLRFRQVPGRASTSRG